MVLAFVWGLWRVGAGDVVVSRERLVIVEVFPAVQEAGEGGQRPRLVALHRQSQESRRGLEQFGEGRVVGLVGPFRMPGLLDLTPAPASTRAAVS